MSMGLQLKMLIIAIILIFIVYEYLGLLKISQLFNNGTTTQQ